MDGENERSISRRSRPTAFAKGIVWNQDEECWLNLTARRSQEKLV